MSEPNPPSSADLHKWEQDPAGNWHRKFRAPVIIGWSLLIAITLGVGGYAWYERVQEQNRIEDRTRELTCGLVGGSDC